MKQCFLCNLPTVIECSHTVFGGLVSVTESKRCMRCGVMSCNYFSHTHESEFDRCLFYHRLPIGGHLGTDNRVKQLDFIAAPSNLDNLVQNQDGLALIKCGNIRAIADFCEDRGWDELARLFHEK